MSEGRESEHFRERLAGSPGEDFRFPGGHEDGVFEMRGRLAILGDDGPAVVENAHGSHATIDHRFDGEGHAGHEDGAFALRPVVGNLGFLVEAPADAMADKLANDAEAMADDEVLDGSAKIAQPTAGTGVGNRLEQRLLSDSQQSFGIVRDVARGDGGGVVADETGLDDANVDFDDIARHDSPRTTDAMNDLLVYGNADVAGKPPVSKKGAFAVVFAHEFGGTAVDLAGGAAGSDFTGERLEDLRGNSSGGAHQFDFARGFDGDALAAHEMKAGFRSEVSGGQFRDLQSGATELKQ